jgi:hypothetical protein
MGLKVIQPPPVVVVVPDSGTEGVPIAVSFVSPIDTPSGLPCIDISPVAAPFSTPAAAGRESDPRTLATASSSRPSSSAMPVSGRPSEDIFIVYLSACTHVCVCRGERGER